MTGHRLVPILTGAVVVMVFSGCANAGSGQLASSPPCLRPRRFQSRPVRPRRPPVGVSATAEVSRLTVYASLGGTVKLSLAGRRPSGVPLTFLVLQSNSGWLEVPLRDRPNGSRGRTSASQVVLHNLDNSLRVSTEQIMLSLYRSGTLIPPTRSRRARAARRHLTERST
jgi:hypothetical protein